ncbi:Hint domain-containing protein [Tropicibacter oceani]|uniref:Hint domain-containing protein n=1 Tax=Tropicibacter oceani TaxID=3058420 RepID=A0ABY8QJG4_9RHOB|nr:Hint domain-containing protein [Tropicibacter oceani]WGW04689.1 Hint domain-containing protein [Tropicibacter oceani]
MATINGGDGNDSLAGSPEADSIYSGAGNDTILAQAGKDTIAAGTGDDAVYGGDDGDSFIISNAFGNDTIVGGEGGIGDDTIDMRAVTTGATVTYDGVESGSIVSGSDTITFSEVEQLWLSSSTDSLDGTASTANLAVRGMDGNDTLVGGSGNDWLDGGQDNDVIYGGEGKDNLGGDYGNDTVHGGFGNDTVQGSFGNDSLSGDDGNDYVYGGFGDDTVLAGDGDDTLGGGRNNDLVDGGSGSDSIFYETSLGTDTILGGEGGSDEDTLAAVSYMSNAVTVTYSGNEAGTLVEGVNTITFSGIEHQYLTLGDDSVDATLDGSSSGFRGGAGADTIRAGSGNDTIDGGTGNDSLDGGSGSDRFLVSDGFGTDTIIGGEGGTDLDTIDLGGLTGAVTATISATESGSISLGANTISFSQIEALTLTGYGDALTVVNSPATGMVINSGAGNDSISVRRSGNVVDGGSGDDSLFAADGQNTLIGGDGNDTLTFGFNGRGMMDGGAGNDLLSGYAGNDHILGGAGDDTIATGGGGSDTLFGGAGADVFKVHYVNGTPGDSLGDATIDGGEEDAAVDTVDFSAHKQGVTVTYIGAEEALFTDGVDAGQFTGIERVVLTDFADSVTGGVGDDSIEAGAGNDTLDGGSGNDTIVGGDGNDRLYGGAGNDRLEGGAGGDWFYTDAGADTMLGGTGRDLYYAEDGFDGDVINFGGHEIVVDNGDYSEYLSFYDVTTSVDIFFTSATGGTGTSGAGDSLSFSNVDGFEGAWSVGGTFDAQLAGFGVTFFDYGGVTSVVGSGYGDLLVAYGADPLGITDRHYDGGAGNDTIDTGDGNDTILGGDGNDNIFARDGNDSIDGGSGNDTIFGGLGGDTIAGGDGDDYIDGGDGDDFLTTGLGQDTLIGGAGNDTLMNSAGDDSLVGGAGDDSIVATLGNDTLEGGDGNDTLDGGADNDSLSGGAGDDVLEGGSGDDYMDGGDDQDRFILRDGFGTDTIIGGEGGVDFDTIDLSALTVAVTVTYTGSEAGTISDGTNTITFSEIEHLNLTDGSDTVDAVTNWADAIHVDGRGGDDSIEGGVSLVAGDTLIGGAGNDTLRGWDGDDTLIGGDGNDVLTGDQGSDSLEGGAGNDQLSSYGGAATLSGGDGSDLFSIFDSSVAFGGTPGIDGVVIDGGEGGSDQDLVSLASFATGATVTFTADEDGTIAAGGETASFSNIEAFYGSNSDDLFDATATYSGLIGDTPGVIIYALSGNDTVMGGRGGDTLDGGDGADSIDGGYGDDTLSGGSGADTISGGLGNDTIDGGAGDDVFTYAAGDGADTITDFNSGNSGALNDGDTTNNDFIDLSAFYDDIFELRADFADDGILNQSNATDPGGDAVDYSNNAQFAPGDGLTFQGANQSSFATDNTGVVCFAAGTLILTPSGKVPIERLRPGDLVVTMDNGPKPLVWIGKRRLDALELNRMPHLKPVEIKPGAFGDHGALVVSPQHGLLLRLEKEQVMVRAKHLAELQSGAVRIKKGCRSVTYYHLLFEQHEVIFSNGLPSESFFPGTEAIKTLDSGSYVELITLFPSLSSEHGKDGVLRNYAQTARGFLRRKDIPAEISALRPL